MSSFDDDAAVGAHRPVHLPIETIECEHKLLHKVEQHAIALFNAAVDEDSDMTLTFSREGILEVSTALFQLLSIHRARKNVS